MATLTNLMIILAIGAGLAASGTALINMLANSLIRRERRARK